MFRVGDVVVERANNKHFRGIVIGVCNSLFGQDICVVELSHAPYFKTFYEAQLQHANEQEFIHIRDNVDKRKQSLQQS